MNSSYQSSLPSFSIQDVEELAQDLDINEEYLLTLSRRGAFIIKPQQVGSDLSESEDQGIIKAFKEALIQKYGENIRSYTDFSSEDKSSGLTFGTIRRVINQAKKEKSDADAYPDQGDMESSMMSTQSDGGSRRRSRDIFQRNKGLSVKTPEVENSSKVFTENREAIAAANRLRDEGFSMLVEVTENTFKAISAIKKKYHAQYNDVIMAKAARDRARGIPVDPTFTKITKIPFLEKVSREEAETLLQTEFSRYAATRRIIHSYLIRNSLFDQKSLTQLNTIDQLSTELLRSVLKQLKELAEQLAEQPGRSEELTRLTVRAFRVSETIQFFILGTQTQLGINTAKKKLQSAIELLKSETVRQERLFEEAQQRLDLASVSFYFAEAQSPRIAAGIAQKNATAIRKGIIAVIKSISKNNKILENPETDQRHKKQISEKITALESISQILEIAAIGYEELRNENEIEVMTGPLFLLKQKIEDEVLKLIEECQDKRVPVDQLSEVQPISKGPFDDISKMLQIFYKYFQLQAEALEEENSQPQNPSDFLDELNHLKADQDTDKIIGANGKIALLANEENSSLGSSLMASSSLVPSSVEFSEHERRAWREGIDLIRLGLCRNFNIRSVERFDEEFKDEFKAGNSLSVAELKAFVEQEKELHESSHFLSSPDDLLDFMERLNRAEGNKIVKWDERTMNFNPFAGESVGLEEGDSREINKQEIIAGRIQARRAIENIFTEASLPHEKITEILARFDIQFPSIHPEARMNQEDWNKLTVEALRSFIERESTKSTNSEGGLWSNYLTNEHIHALVIGGLTALGSTAMSHILNSQLSTTALASLGVGGLVLVPSLLYLNYLRTAPPAVEAIEERER